jgi:hypothetical protein
VKDYHAGSIRFLEAAWDERRALFSYSTSLVDGSYVQDFGHPATVRYTVNSLLGLQRAQLRDPRADPFLAAADSLLDRFLSVHGPTLPNFGDTGLLTAALATRGDSEGAKAQIDHLAELAASGVEQHLVLQELAWGLWGLCAAARTETPGAEAEARALFATLRRRFLDSDSLFARHNTNPLRRHVVSFGATAYFLRALHEYAETFHDEYADALFRHGVERTLALQGPLGQWPWMIGVSSAQAVDPYPVFSVHQDSMSMLFLLPAIDRGVEGVERAIDLSLSWLTGRNELGLSMIVPEPFFVFRSFERAARLQKPTRYARTVWHTLLRTSSGYLGPAGLRVNRECRSYQLGWVLFVWSGRTGGRVLGVRPAT